MSNLLPCPLCKGEAGYAMCSGGRKHVIYCTEDECYISLVDYIAVDIKNVWNIRAPQWQPIETAPRDGTLFVGYRLGKVGPQPIVALCYGNKHGIFRDDFKDNAYATHWTPLPQPSEEK